MSERLDQKENRTKQKNLLRLFFRKVFEPFNLMRPKLQERCFTVSDLWRILKISKRQLSNWESHGMVIMDKKKNERQWRRFSLVDLYALFSVKYLRKWNIPLELCSLVFIWLRENLHSNPIIYYYLSEKADIYILIDILLNKFRMVIRSDIMSDNLNYQMQRIGSPQILLPLMPIFLGWITTSQIPGFSWKEQNDRLIFIVDGREIKFDLSENEKEIIGDCALFSEIDEGVISESINEMLTREPSDEK